jgi:hypothetical protein
MPWTRSLLWLAGGFLLACGSEPRAPELPRFNEAFSTLPLPPNAEFVSRSGSSDALQITLRTPEDPEKVAGYYRAMLTRGNWRLVSDLKNPDGATVLYAEQDGPPLWVRISKPTDRPGSLVQLTGAVSAKDSVPGRKS